MRKIADETGGGYFELAKTVDLSPTFSRVAQELRSHYLIGFAPATLDGKVHKLEVRVVKTRDDGSGEKELSGRARSQLSADVLLLKACRYRVSFFLAVPTLLAAGAYQLYKERALLSAVDAGWFGVGFLASFVSAFFCVRWLLRYVSAHDLRPFAWYRIAFGLVVIVTADAGVVSWTVR